MPNVAALTTGRRKQVQTDADYVAQLRMSILHRVPGQKLPREYRAGVVQMECEARVVVIEGNIVYRTSRWT